MFAEPLTAATALQNPIVIGNGGRFCGRSLHPVDGVTVDNSGVVCCKSTHHHLEVWASA